MSAKMDANWNRIHTCTNQRRAGRALESRSRQSLNTGRLSTARPPQIYVDSSTLAYKNGIVFITATRVIFD